MKPKSHWDNLVKDHLQTSPDQHNRQMRNFVTEAVLRSHESKYPVLLDFKNTAVKGLKMRRLAERPLLIAVCKIDEKIKATRVIGLELGFTYPEEVPLRRMMGPKEVKDHLALLSSSRPQ